MQSRKERKEEEKRQRKGVPAVPWVLNSSGTSAGGTCLCAPSAPCLDCKMREYNCRLITTISKETDFGR
jgi:hypothetical protein